MKTGVSLLSRRSLCLGTGTITVTSSDSRQPGLKGLALWGAWIGLVGGIMGALGLGFSLWDRLTPPGLEMVEVLPICVSVPRNTNLPHVSVFGISAIVRCRAGSRTAFVSALDFLGRTYHSVHEYPGDAQFSGKKNMDEIQAEVSARKPYSTISWNGWPEDQGVSVRLEPYEEKYIRFVFLEPALFLYTHMGGPPHLGYADGSKEPERTKTSPSLFDIFKLRLRTEKDGQATWAIWTPFGLRNEIRDDTLSFS